MRVLIHGATGLAGSLVARALARAGCELTLAGRDAGRLERAAAALAGPVAVQPVQVHDSAACERAVSGHDVVVVCAGPHGRVAEPLLAAALAAGAHYLDIALEQAFVRGAYERHEAAARRAGVTAVSGLGAAGGVGDLAARVAAAAVGVHAGADAAPADAIRVAYALERLHAAPGLRHALVDALAGPAWVWAGDRWDTSGLLGERRRVRFAAEGDERVVAGVPVVEAITVPRHTAASLVQGFVAVPDAVATAGRLGPALSRLAPLASPFMSAALRSPLGAYARALASARSHTPGADERAASRVTVAVEAERGGARARVIVHMRDPYAITAELVALAVERLAAAPAPRAGALAPAELLDAEDALAALGERAGLVIERA